MAPTANEDGGKASGAGPDARQMMTKKALIIEDDSFMITNLTELLGFEGFEVDSVTEGAQAPNHILDFRPDVILSDMRMPGMDGLAILGIVRENPQTMNIPFVFLTGRSDSDQLRAAQEAGANGYLIKPFEIDDLLNLINELVP